MVYCQNLLGEAVSWNSKGKGELGSSPQSVTSLFWSQKTSLFCQEKSYILKVFWFSVKPQKYLEILSFLSIGGFPAVEKYNCA